MGINDYNEYPKDKSCRYEMNPKTSDILINCKIAPSRKPNSDKNT